MLVCVVRVCVCANVCNGSSVCWLLIALCVSRVRALLCVGANAVCIVVMCYPSHVMCVCFSRVCVRIVGPACCAVFVLCVCLCVAVCLCNCV